jgi:hypothetical protein
VAETICWPSHFENPDFRVTKMTKRGNLLVNIQSRRLFAISDFLGNPCRITPQLNNRPDDRRGRLEGVKNTVWKNPAQKPVIICFNKSVNPRRKAEPLNIGPQAACEIIAQPGCLCLIEEEAFVQIIQRILGDLILCRSLT